MMSKTESNNSEENQFATTKSADEIIPKENTQNAYEVTIYKDSATSTSSDINAYTDPDQVSYRIGNDRPNLLLFADNFLQHLDSSFGTSFNRMNGDNLQIIIKPTTIPQGISTIGKNDSNTLSCTLVEADTPQSIRILEEFIQKANNSL